MLLLKKISLGLFLFLSCFTIQQQVYAQELIQDKTNVVEARVISIDKITTDTIRYATGIPHKTQTITAEITSGVDKGKKVIMDNDYIMLTVGENFFANHIIRAEDKHEIYNVAEPNRLRALSFLAVLFIVVLFLFGGIQGIRGLASLIGSLGLIIYVLIPGILNGYSPILVSLGAASIIIIVGSFITHGLNKTTLSAVIGMVGTVVITGILASIAVNITRLTGQETEEAIYLSWNTGGSINLAGLLLGGILIGLLGVLYDVAIGQAISVEELLRANPNMHKITLYKRATRIGREHIGALVNTLAIAYVGASLPLLLLFSTGNSESLKFTLNRELFATEIVRTLIGSIGLIIAVPITTFITVLILTKAKVLPHSHSGHSH